MSKHIKLDDAIERKNELYHCYEVEEWLKSLPTTEIVHCKDCKYSNVYALDSNEEPQRWCKVGLAKVVNDDDYCSWGEK